MTVVEALRDADFDVFHGVYTAAYSRDFDCPWLAIEKRVNMTDDAYGNKVVLAARDETGEIVGGGTAILPLRDNLTFAFLDVFVHPDSRRRGHGTAVLDALLEHAVAAGRSTGFVQPYWAVEEKTSAAREFAEARGFTLDMLDAVRELRLPAELAPVDVADGYRLQTWRGACPDDLLDEYAELRRILTAEAPSGAAGLENEHWDAARVRKDEADLERVGRVMVVTVARAGDGSLAGHTQLAFPRGREVYQWDTLVRPAHRGHGLGLALKIRTMHESADLLAGRRRIVTENAASNTHMIAVNEALGFRQVAWVGEHVRSL
jgi:GNAT superfamily N-acetyltransferase